MGAGLQTGRRPNPRHLAGGTTPAQPRSGQGPASDSDQGRRPARGPRRNRRRDVIRFALLRPRIDRGPARPRVVTRLAAHPVPHAHRAARRSDRRRVLRHRQVPLDPLAATAARHRAARRTQEPRPRLRRCRDRGAAPGVLRQPVRPDVPAVRPLRRPAVGARGGRPHRPGQRGPRPGHVRVRRHEQGRAEPDQDPRPHRHGGAGADRRPVPRRPPALRLPAHRRRTAPEPGQGRRRQAAARLETDPEAAAVVAADLRLVPAAALASTPSPRG